MSLAGVRANRGDSYQTLIALGWAIDVLSSDKYEWIEVDSTSLVDGNVPISVDDIVVGHADGYITCCQCKKNQTDFVYWTVSNLGDELVKAGKLLANNPHSRVVFYSRGNFGALAKLREYAVTQGDVIAYQTSLTVDNKKVDIDLSGKLPANINTYNFLCRTTFEVSPELERMNELLLERLSYFVSDANIAFNALYVALDNLSSRIGSDYASASPSCRLSKSDLRDMCINAGSVFVRPQSQDSLRDIFLDVSSVGRQWRRDIGGKQVQVAAVDDLIVAIEAKEHSILLSGGPGSGKTCILLELQDRLEKRKDIAPLFIQAREYLDCVTPDTRTSKGLPEDLVGYVGRMADNLHTVVIIDSLDVLSLSREHTVLSYFLAQIDRLLLIQNVTVIAACREFDRKYDSRLSGREWDRTIVNPSFDWDLEIIPILNEYNISPEAIDDATRTLIKNPRELALFTDIAKRTGGFNVTTSLALCRKYLDVIVQNDVSLGKAAMEAIEKIAEDMLISRRLYVPYVRVGVSDEMIQRMLSAEILHRNHSGDIEFGHQTLLDVLVVSGAERNRLTLQGLIEKLPAVPFVRPTIRAYISYLALSDRGLLRRQLRAVIDSNAAFHIRRLLVESLAEQVPQQDDWLLILHLYRNHRELFNSLYMHANSIEWHHFWLQFFVPCIKEEQNENSLIMHLSRTCMWVEIDEESVFSFWTDALGFSWTDHSKIAWSISVNLSNCKLVSSCYVAPLIEILINSPNWHGEFFGRVIARCIDKGLIDDNLLWLYITKNNEQEDGDFNNFDIAMKKISDDFGADNFLYQRMAQSIEFLGLVFDAIEGWSGSNFKAYSNDRTWHDGFLSSTSYEAAHSSRGYVHLSGEKHLLSAFERAVLMQAEQHTHWWISNKERFYKSHEGALRYIAILAFTASPDKNISDVAHIVLDKEMWQSQLNYEMGSLLNSSFMYMDEVTQSLVQNIILTLYEDQANEYQYWVLKERVQLLSAIPAYFRSPEVSSTLASYKKIYGEYVREPEIRSAGGWVAPPFSYELFLESLDETIVKILLHYSKEHSSFSLREDFLIGGASEVGVQLYEASSRNPSRFLNLLKCHWEHIPRKFSEDILSGSASYLAHRYGSLQSNNQWVPIEEPNPQALVILFMEEIERNFLYWRSCDVTAKVLQACAFVIRDESNSMRLLFNAIGFVHFHTDDRNENNLGGLIATGINMGLGNVAESVIILATYWADKGIFPELLIPTLKSLASNQNPAVRALILQRLPYFHSHVPELGWEIFYLILADDSEELWRIGEPFLYYSYINQFSKVAQILDYMVSNLSGRPLETWGRISALASLSGLIDEESFLSQLHSLNSTEAWSGAASVWARNIQHQKYRDQCLLGIRIGLQSINVGAFAVANKLSSVFEEDLIIYVPSEIASLYLSAMENGSERFYMHGFDKWLNSISKNKPDDALVVAERFLVFVKNKGHHIYDHEPISQLLTGLFREAEEREEADNGAMLEKVIAVQDGFLSLGLNGLHNWLRDAERP